ncbi:MAG: T9SS type A sorting domain-containing protein [Bacteroidetes bacterium]|nr:T9SS type A sorting domain-containing protein [Bacteroidota bacterium]
MNRLLLLLCFVCCSLFTSAQNKTYSYHFFYGFKEKTTIGPDLAPQCSTGTFNWQTMYPGIGKVAYNFGKGCGLVFNDSTTSFLSSGNYTIELFFKLDTINGYKKLVDIKNMAVDSGLYNQNGKLVLYPVVTSDSFLAASKYDYVAITHDATTKKVVIYHKGDTARTFMDNNDRYVYDYHKRIVFFKDDNNTSGEQTSGSVSYIAISNWSMPQDTIKQHYNNLNTILLGVPVTENTTNSIKICPNPVIDNVLVTAAKEGTYIISGITGQILNRGYLQQGDNTINLSKFAEGIYILKVTNNEGKESQTFKLIKQ